MRVSVKEVDRGWKDLKKTLAALKQGGSYTKVGILGSNAEKEVEGGGITTVRLAMVHEFGATIDHPGGTPYAIGKGGRAVFLRKGESAPGWAGTTKPHKITIPERSYLRSTFEEKRSSYVEALKKMLAKVYEGKLSIAQVLGVLGLKMVADVKGKIRSGIAPPNAPATLRRKLKAGKWNEKDNAARGAEAGSPVALINTGQNLLNRITHRVVVKDGPLAAAEAPTKPTKKGE